MNQIYADDGLLFCLKAIVGTHLTYRLFTNNVTPDRDTVLGDLTEAGWTGYVEIDVSVGDFNTESVVGHKGKIQAEDIAFSNGSGGDVEAYGYYVTDAADGFLLFAARFDGAPVTVPDGETLNVTPVLGDRSSVSS